MKCNHALYSSAPRVLHYECWRRLDIMDAASAMVAGLLALALTLAFVNVLAFPLIAALAPLSLVGWPGFCRAALCRRLGRLHLLCCAGLARAEAQVCEAKVTGNERATLASVRLVP